MSSLLPYQNPALPIDARVDDLIARMTLAEKIGQCWQTGLFGESSQGDPNVRRIHEEHAGSFVHAHAAEVNRLQAIAETTRLRIPLLFATDAIHGHAFFLGATIFPTPLALASSWNVDLLHAVARATAVEAAATGVRWNFSPVLCVARDLRWGRVGETFGEDPWLIGVFAEAMVRGYQTDDLSEPTAVAACAKHFVAYGETQGGRDSSEADVSPRKLLTYFLPPFERVIRAGCRTVMAAYQAIDGVPCSAHRGLLHDTLRAEWQFHGVVVSDCDNVGAMHTRQKVCASLDEAIIRAMQAGNDVAMATRGICARTLHLVETGQLDVAYVDAACRRMLRLKFELGLFERPPHVDLEAMQRTLANAEHVALARAAARESMVLLKNNGVLPLAPNVARVALLGPQADNIQTQLGDWTFNRYGDEKESPRHVTTLRAGLSARLRGSAEVLYARGAEVIGEDLSGLDEAVALARQSDVAVIAVGDTPVYAGEWRSRSNLQLSVGQLRLIEAVKATGVPLVVVLINTKPLVLSSVVEHADAIVEAWNPGMEGGHAVAELLCGDFNPSARLTISFPRATGQTPIFYNELPGAHGAYFDLLDNTPLFPFGFGLAYTQFSYANLAVEKAELDVGETLVAEVDVQNIGPRAGVETVQLYVNDVYASVTVPVKELKAFARVSLEPGQKRRVRLTLPCRDLSLINERLERVVEPGEFTIMVGSSSRDTDLLRTTVRIGATANPLTTSTLPHLS